VPYLITPTRRHGQAQEQPRITVTKAFHHTSAMVFWILGIFQFFWDVLFTIISISWNFFVTLFTALFDLFHFW